ncbi:MAG: hypothetical protein IPP33_08430 [Flavobacteriales bacterium]|nr:hypothetical protein [Flavobacteriales bacterium]
MRSSAKAQRHRQQLHHGRAPWPCKNIGDAIKAGGRQRGAGIELEVLRSFADSRLKKLWAEQGGAHDRPAMPRDDDNVARRFTIAVLLISIGCGLVLVGRILRRSGPW